MDKKLLLIVNPYAGKMKAQKILFDIVYIFSCDGYEVTVIPTKERNDAINIIETHPATYNLIVCCGGDGTLNEVFNGLMRLKEIIPLGYIPIGTTNDFAATHEIPIDPIAAAENIIQGKNYPVDVGYFNNNLAESSRYFAYVAAFGLFTSVPYIVSQETKKIWGHFAYLLEGIKQSIEIPSYELSIEYDGNLIEDEFVLGTITNSTSVAGLLKFDKSDVNLNDGEFEVLLIKNPHNDMQLKMIIIGLAMQQYDERYVMFFRASQIKISCNEPLSWCLDGEDGGLHTDIVINNLPKQILMRL